MSEDVRPGAIVLVRAAIGRIEVRDELAAVDRVFDHRGVRFAVLLPWIGYWNDNPNLPDPLTLRAENLIVEFPASPERTVS